MKLLYLDHSLVARHTCWPAIEAAVKGGGYQLALSVWNLCEIGHASDIPQQNERLKFLEGFRPVWLFDRRQTQKREIERYVWCHMFGVPARSDDIPFNSTSLSAAVSYYGKARTEWNLTPRRFIDTLDLDELAKLKAVSPWALERYRRAGAKAVVAAEEEVFGRWIEDDIPNVNPEGRILTKLEKRQAVQMCWDTRARFFSECSTLAVEDALTKARTSNPERKPKDGDGHDLQHSVVALAFCQVFLTGDGFQRRCAEQAVKLLPGLELAAVYASPSEVPAS